MKKEAQMSRVEANLASRSIEVNDLSQPASQPKTSSRTVSIRLSPEDHALIDEYAKFDGVAVSEEIRTAVQMLIQQRRGDPGFRMRVESSLKRAQELLNELGDDAAGMDISL
jgi:hypothetical protein